MAAGVKLDGAALTQWLDYLLQQERSAAEQRHRRIIVELRARLDGDVELGRGLQLACTVVATGWQQADAPVTPREEGPVGAVGCLGSAASAGSPNVNTGGADSTESNVKPTPSTLTASDVLPRHNADKMSRLFDGRREEDKDPVVRIVKGALFESFFGILILVNALVMAVEVQYLSDGLAYAVGMHELADGAPPTVQYEAGGIFKIADVLFGVLFWIELIMNVYVKCMRFLRTGWNCFDLVVMLAWTVDILSAGSFLALNPTILRVCRLARLLRLVRLVRSYELFDSLVLMVSSIKASLWVLIWSAVILCGIMVVTAMVLNSLVSRYIVEGPEEDLVVRQRIFSYFGSFTRSMVTLFEITLGNWVPVCRTLMDNVTEWYGLVFILYKLFVGFGILKVIGAIFLCETMKCASLDDELMIQTKERQKKKFMEKMAYLFEEADKTNDGLISREEFTKALSQPRVCLWLQAMELNFPDASMVFDMLDVSGDGHLEYVELVKGMSNLKGMCTQIHLECVDRQSRLTRHFLRTHTVTVQASLDHQSLRLDELCRTVLQLKPVLKQANWLIADVDRKEPRAPSVSV